MGVCDGKRAACMDAVGTAQRDMDWGDRGSRGEREEGRPGSAADRSPAGRWWDEGLRATWAGSLGILLGFSVSQESRNKVTGCGELQTASFFSSFFSIAIALDGFL